MAVLANDPSAPRDLREKSLRLAAHLLECDPQLRGGAGYQRARELLDSGAALRQIVRNTAATPVHPEQLWRVLQDALATNREAFRRLTNTRINLRAHRSPAIADSMPPPEALLCYPHRGN